MIKRLKRDLLTARKNKDKFRAGVLGALVSEAVMIGKNNGNRETTDQECLSLIQKFKKGVVENLNLTASGHDYFEKRKLLRDEISVYNEYLPKQLTEEEIVKEIGIFIGKDPSHANIGKIMGHFKQKFEGQFDGKELARITKEVINGD